jgi:hypothetical protein
MKTMKDAQQAKADKALNQLIRHAGVTMTKREFIEYEHRNGAKVEEGTKPAAQWNRTRYNRMDGWQQAEYEKKLNETKPCYKLYTKATEGNFPSVFFEISKTEYDYFLTLIN